MVKDRSKCNTKSYQGLKVILLIIDVVTSYLITLSIQQSRSEEIGDTLIDNVILT